MVLLILLVNKDVCGFSISGNFSIVSKIGIGRVI